MGRITPSPRQLYEATVEDLRRFYRGALIDNSHRAAFDLLLRDAWEPEQAAMATKKNAATGIFNPFIKRF